MIDTKKFKKIGLRSKILLMGLQIFLPFVLYLAIRMGIRPLGIAVGVLLALSMLVMVVFG
jgi:hypothetical protein